MIKPAHRARLVAPAPGRETEAAVSPSRCGFSSKDRGTERQGGWGVFQSGLKRFLWQMFRQRALTYLIAASQVFPWASLVAQRVRKKNLPAMQEAQVRSLGQEDPLEQVMATHSSILAWRIPRTEEPGGPQSMAVTRNRTRLSDSQFPMFSKGGFRT